MAVLSPWTPLPLFVPLQQSDTLLSACVTVQDACAQLLRTVRADADAGAVAPLLRFGSTDFWK